MSRPYDTYKDPELFARRHPRREDLPLVLGLDYGTSCGYAFTYLPTETFDPNELDIYLGVLDLSIGPYDSGALRLVRLRQFLTVMSPAMIFCEDVKNTPAGMHGRSVAAIMARAATAAEFLGALKSVTATFAELHGIPLGAIPIAHIKKRATGKGNAGKPDMVVAMNEHFGLKIDPEDEHAANVADALFTLLEGLDRYGKGLAWPSQSQPAANELPNQKQ